MTLTEFLLATAPISRRLSLVHCTTVGSGLNLLDHGNLKPTRCPVYKTDLLYLFYGRPAYKPAAGVGASGILDLAPICLVLDPTLIDSAVRVVPFDSGGFARYEALIGPNLKRSDFELNGDPSLPLRLVKAFYQTNRNYYDQAPTVRESDLPPSRRTARALARLINDPAIRNIDDRCGAIELQFSTAIPLADALQAIVAPSAMLDDSDVLQALARCPGAVPIPYKTYGRFEPLGFANTIYERVDSFLERKGSFA
ncbi:hypothetical protein [Mesorhizobium sp. B2-4-6]|uniref:hypothetical protein n=1 Tax=Mesorhizobium sp. B2-4-6 TaxID=2589943 RepID=UPI00112D27F8|nr:hypothetical protein [Mesorhizobium sp. B2-4-6]TPL49775.1 hypothetical protein FJ957_11970 [Mesorhizobium sp. B2-4-6]